MNVHGAEVDRASFFPPTNREHEDEMNKRRESLSKKIVPFNKQILRPQTMTQAFGDALYSNNSHTRKSFRFYFRWGRSLPHVTCEAER